MPDARCPMPASPPAPPRAPSPGQASLGRANERSEAEGELAPRARARAPGPEHRRAVDALSLQCLGALSLILDLANGFGEDKSLLCAAFALRLAQEEGMEAPAQRAAWLAALLRHLGCTAFAATEASLVSDDIELRRQLQ